MNNKPVFPWLIEDMTTKVAVIGDIMLDEYLDGHVNRISPEAPVPIHLVKDRSLTAGGAANVARNIKLAGGNPLIFATCGEDSSGEQLVEILKRDDIDTSGIMKTKDRSTIKKTRISANNQQLLRIDWEDSYPLHESIQTQLFTKLQESSFDLLVISDYGKGTLSPSFIKDMNMLAHSKRVFSIVDPKGKNFEKYVGCDLITPNYGEACEALGIDPSRANLTGLELGKKLQETYGLKHILITMGPRGMYFVPSNESHLEQKYLPAKVREAYDVSGAGDTVIALMSLGLGSKADFFTSMEIANIGAGVVVEKWGTQPITLTELKQAWKTDRLGNSTKSVNMNEKIITFESLTKLVSPPHKRKEKIVFTNGCFDLFHAGHAKSLKEAKDQGDVLIVGVNSDESIKKLKGPGRPIMSLEDRLNILSAIEFVDYVIPFSAESPIEIIREIKPDILVKGGEYKPEDIVGSEIISEWGGSTYSVKMVESISTTEIIKKIKQN